MSEAEEVNVVEGAVVERAFETVATHSKARTEKPADYPDRFLVPDAVISWSTPFPDYNPPYYVAAVVLENDGSKKQGGWADPEDISKISRPLVSYGGSVNLDEKGFPLNPEGRTGIRGRGKLGKWGPNFAADPIVTRINPTTGTLEMAAIVRKDNDQLAIPGGMVDFEEKVTGTLKREFKEEAGGEIDFEDAVEVYEGYVDDPRNTDNAWMETKAYHKHLEGAAANIELTAGDDAAKVRWIELNNDNISHLYASHATFVRRAITFLKTEKGFDISGDGKVINR